MSDELNAKDNLKANVRQTAAWVEEGHYDRIGYAQLVKDLGHIQRTYRKQAKKEAAATVTITKKALIREEGYPAGVRAPVFVRCCGEKVPIVDEVNPCPNCGTQYNVAGYVINQAVAI